MAITYAIEKKSALERKKLDEYVCLAWARFQRDGQADHFASWVRGFARHQPDKNTDIRKELTLLLRMAKSMKA